MVTVVVHTYVCVVELYELFISQVCYGQPHAFFGIAQHKRKVGTRECLVSSIMYFVAIMTVDTNCQIVLSG